MSNNPVRVTFPDGQVLYGVGDCSELVSRRLYSTRDEAWAAYCDDSIYLPIASSYYEAAQVVTEVDKGAVPVRLETTYGSRDYSWQPMHAQNARASASARLITQLPSYGAPE